MKKITLTAALLLASSVVLAAPPVSQAPEAARETAPVPKTMTPEQFEAQKQKIVQALDKQVMTVDKQLKTLRDSRNCVAAAKLPDAVRDCMSSLRIAPPRGDERGPQGMERGPRHGKHGPMPGAVGPMDGEVGNSAPRH